MPNSRDAEQLRTLAQHILLKAVAYHGTAHALAKNLGVEYQVLTGWIAGQSIPPAEIILKAVAPLVMTGDPDRFWDKSVTRLN